MGDPVELCVAHICPHRSVEVIFSPRQKWAMDRQKGAGPKLCLGFLPSEAESSLTPSGWPSFLGMAKFPSVSPNQAHLCLTPSPQTTCC